MPKKPRTRFGGKNGLNDKRYTQREHIMYVATLNKQCCRRKLMEIVKQAPLPKFHFSEDKITAYTN